MATNTQLLFNFANEKFGVNLDNYFNEMIAMTDSKLLEFILAMRDEARIEKIENIPYATTAGEWLNSRYKILCQHLGDDRYIKLMMGVKREETINPSPKQKNLCNGYLIYIANQKQQN